MAGMYIPGVEKPECCLYCPCYDHRGYCAAFQREMTHEQVYVKRPDNCKAIFVPDHGRLVDMQKLHEKLDDAPTARFTPGEIAWVIDQEECSPTIIPAERKEQ